MRDPEVALLQRRSLTLMRKQEVPGLFPDIPTNQGRGERQAEIQGTQTAGHTLGDIVEKSPGERDRRKRHRLTERDRDKRQRKRGRARTGMDGQTGPVRKRQLG